jgi:8-oxo-dGTP pyrophosphatase MutT (NUDIX family)
MAIKVCPVVIRTRNGQHSILAFRHPTAGIQIVKGSPQPNEALATAALRELWEESGITATRARAIGTAPIGATADDWHFFLCDVSDLPDTWAHQTVDDHGHVFTFFWPSAQEQPDANWHPIFHAAFAHIIRLLN